jgi:predicted sugar kinase
MDIISVQWSVSQNKWLSEDMNSPDKIFHIVKVAGDETWQSILCSYGPFLYLLTDANISQASSRNSNRHASHL